MGYIVPATSSTCMPNGGNLPVTILGLPSTLPYIKLCFFPYYCLNGIIYIFDVSYYWSDDILLRTATCPIFFNGSSYLGNVEILSSWGSAVISSGWNLGIWDKCLLTNCCSTKLTNSIASGLAYGSLDNILLTNFTRSGE